jgi:hypothetical protein
MARVDEHHSRDLLRMCFREQLHIATAKRVAHEHVRWRVASCCKQRPEILHDVFRIAWLRGGLTLNTRACSATSGATSCHGCQSSPSPDSKTTVASPAPYSTTSTRGSVVVSADGAALVPQAMAATGASRATALEKEKNPREKNGFAKDIVTSWLETPKA